MVKKLAAFGHSHLSAVRRAYQSAEKNGQDLPAQMQFTHLNFKMFQPNYETVSDEKAYSESASGQDTNPFLRIAARMTGGGYHSFDALDRPRALTENVQKRIKHILRRDAPDAIVLACMGNEYNAMGILRHPEPFDFDLPGSGIEVEKGVTVIPYPMMRAQMTMLCEQNVLLFWRYFNKVTDKPIYLLPPPPPIADKMHILSYPGAFEGPAKQYGISPAGLRRKMWLLYCDILRDMTRGTGTTFVELPDAVFVDGCLAKQFWQEDPTHGNADYGKLILEHVQSLITGPVSVEGA